MSQAERPLVSVVLPTYDRPDFLSEAIQTVNDQTYDPLELVIVDGPSEKPAKEVLEEEAPDNITDSVVIRNEVKGGLSSARNDGISAASGEYIAFLDDDDRWDRTKIEKQVEKFQVDHVGLVYTGRKVESEFTPTFEGDVTGQLLCNNFVGTPSTVMVRTAVVDEIDGFDERLSRMEEWDFYLRISQDWEFGAVPEALTIHTVSGHEQLSDDFDAAKQSVPLFIEKHLQTAAACESVSENKMKGFVYSHVAQDAQHVGEYWEALKYITLAIRYYPIEPIFYAYFFAYLGGDRTVRTLKNINAYRIWERLDPR
jgi:glycosyltransferase involved in cell wall biosynthesis